MNIKQDFKKAVRHWIRTRFHSIKASTNGTTYDRYDTKYGLHKCYTQSK
ncbi:hypothetical protein FDI95_gp150 [Citrobacter phage CF1 ERZ-2017]|uniref:Uncharacterized protein n=2 Tax=Moonvirus TaxID=1985329 RepID=A0A0K1LMQ0_9CAUD|nr:hypothetical protein CPT_Merlin155 [Citrobacter phage Merlin]YP_009618209.1 hypothetical protein FDI95_gp150 [Citrobacter phage CF1 ERZ-2017]AKU43801.1 hypothetical protein CPT_Merlin155 [Citrobacter phage Merlin]AUE23023.1 hypothetical protein Cf1_00150 [Citrobacter phage CF1 ERZ-2017]